MKKMCIVTGFIILCVALFGLAPRGWDCLEGIAPDDALFCLYLDSKPTTHHTVVQNGNGYVLTTTFDDVPKIKSMGQSLSFEGSFEQVAHALKLKEFFRESVQGMTVIYGYSPAFKNTVELHGYNVNVQIALKNGDITIGTPLILGSF